MGWFGESCATLMLINNNGFRERPRWLGENQKSTEREIIENETDISTSYTHPLPQLVNGTHQTCRLLALETTYESTFALINLLFVP
jgi:hypothetical protein